MIGALHLVSRHRGPRSRFDGDRAGSREPHNTSATAKAPNQPGSAWRDVALVDGPTLPLGTRPARTVARLLLSAGSSMPIPGI
jgi:hypothetical protein